jgi:cyclopropane-fatty-acyl-phospholipid synthase
MRTPRVGTPAATRILHLVADAIGAPLPIRLRAWDGSEAGPDDGPTLVVHNRRALRHVTWAPGHLGLARAYVAGDLDVEGDMFTFLEAFLQPAWRAATPRPSTTTWWRLAGTAAGLGALGPRPPLPPEEMRQRAGGRHTKSRDAAAVTHHYDVSNDFYRVILGDSMVYSCAYFADGGGQEFAESRLDDAQQAKLDLVCRKLALAPGQRLLDVGCGWGSLALHAALKYGVEVVGVTLSQAQADLARRRVRESGMEQLVQIRLQDYRDVDDDTFDAISSIGMAEHVGRRQFSPTANACTSCCDRAGGY